MISKLSGTIRIHTSLERWRYSIGLLTTTTLITQLLTPQPEPSIVNDPKQQADYWRNKSEAKSQENEALIEMNAELESAIEELEKEVERLNDEYTACGSHNDTSNDISDNYSSESLEVEATFYTAFCSTGCIGITATGLDVSSTIYTPDGYRVIAVDPSGDIRGNRIDILVESTDEAFRLGRQAATVEILTEGKR